MSLALGLLALLSAVVHLLAREASALALATKPLPALCLMRLALRHGRGAYPRALAAGFAVSAAGDLLLELHSPPWCPAARPTSWWCWSRRRWR